MSANLQELGLYLMSGEENFLPRLLPNLMVSSFCEKLFRVKICNHLKSKRFQWERRNRNKMHTYFIARSLKGRKNCLSDVLRDEDNIKVDVKYCVCEIDSTGSVRESAADNYEHNNGSSGA